MPDGDLVFLDTETTGLDPARHEVWEIAWAVNDGPIECYQVEHSLRTADPEALELNGYHVRGAGAEPWPGYAELELRDVLDGATVVGSNPAFDTAFLRARWGVAPWHHRMIAVETYAMPVLGLRRPVGLARVADLLRERGYTIPQPDHSAAGDVATLRAVFEALEWEAFTPPRVVSGAALPVHTSGEETR